MQLFPIKKVTLAFTVDRLILLDRLRSNTKLTDMLVSHYTDKSFIGQVYDAGFKLISSEIGRGAVCVFVGTVQDTLAEIEIRIHTAFKILFSILMLMPIISILVSVFMQGAELTLGIIIPTVVAIAFIRYVFIELSFRLIAKTGLNKLKHITGMGELKNEY